MINIIIDATFQAMIAPPTTAEYELLETSILAEGCRDSLVLWGNILIDGHNRHKVCTQHGIEFNVVNRDFGNRDAVADWIYSNQLGRRNLTLDQMKILRGRRYNLLKKDKENNLLPGGPSIGQIDPSSKISTSIKSNTADMMAKQYGISASTIKREGVEAELIDKHPKQAAAIIRGDLKRTDVIKELKPTSKNTGLNRNVPSVEHGPSPDDTVVIRCETVSVNKKYFDEIVRQHTDYRVESETFEKIVDGDDKLFEAVATIKQQVAMITALRVRFEGEQNKNNELIRMIKAKDRRIAKLEKELEAYKLENLPL